MYTFNQLSKKSKSFALDMYNKYNNPKKLNGSIELLNPIWKFNKKGEISTGLSN